MKGFNQTMLSIDNMIYVDKDSRTKKLDNLKTGTKVRFAFRVEESNGAKEYILTDIETIDTAAGKQPEKNVPAAEPPKSQEPPAPPAPPAPPVTAPVKETPNGPFPILVKLEKQVNGTTVSLLKACRSEKEVQEFTGTFTRVLEVAGCQNGGSGTA